MFIYCWQLFWQSFPKNNSLATGCVCEEHFESIQQSTSHCLCFACSSPFPVSTLSTTTSLSWDPWLYESCYLLLSSPYLLYRFGQLKVFSLVLWLCLALSLGWMPGTNPAVIQIFLLFPLRNHWLCCNAAGCPALQTCDATVCIESQILSFRCNPWCILVPEYKKLHYTGVTMLH